MTSAQDPTFSNAWTMLNSYLQSWGLSSLATQARGMLTGGDTPDVITLKLQATPEYQQRFAANATRIAKGLRALSPAEYLENERQYADVLRQNGLPQGFYDQPEDFQKFLENDVSPQELTDRAKAAQANYVNATPEVKDQMNRFMNQTGVQPNQILASILDPDRAWPDMQRTINAADIAAEAQRSFRDPNTLTTDRAMQLATAGVSQDQARQAFGELAGRQQRDTYLAGLNGQQLTAQDQQNELFFNDAAAKGVRMEAQNAEQARFHGNYLGTDQRSGFGLMGTGGGDY